MTTTDGSCTPAFDSRPTECRQPDSQAHRQMGVAGLNLIVDAAYINDHLGFGGRPQPQQPPMMRMFTRLTCSKWRRLDIAQPDLCAYHYHHHRRHRRNHYCSVPASRPCSSKWQQGAWHSMIPTAGCSVDRGGISRGETPSGGDVEQVNGAKNPGSPTSIDTSIEIADRCLPGHL